MMKKMKGFTLAEVLTTLMVIGVVAALTIPTLISSTNESQYQAAYKKALANLENGIGLLKANQTSCVVRSDAELAECFKNVLQGTLVNKEGKSTGTKDTILTSDGVAYRFVYSGERDKDKGRAIDSFCPAFTRSVGGMKLSKRAIHRGENGNCAVLVDLDGFSKGTTQFNQEFEGITSDISGILPSVIATEEGDQQLILIGSDGAYPYRDSDNIDSVANKGFNWMNGKDTELNDQEVYD